jgi:glycerol-3-phosphate dehydrogenase
VFELARTLEDLLRRRFGVALGRLRRDPGLIAAAAAAMAEICGWDGARREREVADYLATLE